MKRVSFVIPGSGSEHTLEGVITEINEVRLPKKSDYTYEIICVVDCSPDNVLEKLKGLLIKQENLTVVNLALNSGKHAAVMAGYSYVTGDYVVNLDDDGQCPMDRLWDLIEKLEAGSDFATAKYKVKKQSKFKNFGSNVNNVMTKILLEKPREFRFENFSVAKRFVIEEILNYRNPYPFLEGLYLRTTHNLATVEMDERDRFEGEGGFTLKKSLSLWLNGFTAFSIKPLRLATILGFLVAAVGFVYAVVLVIQFFARGLMPGFASMMVTTLVIGGIIMMLLGLIGEYVGRIYISINNAPQYVIREVLKSTSDKEVYSDAEKE
jgi:undecaprenyl-phosphate 4-deoxy-4-formamido-L-arabinose transferase